MRSCCMCSIGNVSWCKNTALPLTSVQSWEIKWIVQPVRSIIRKCPRHIWSYMERYIYIHDMVSTWIYCIIGIICWTGHHQPRWQIVGFSAHGAMNWAVLQSLGEDWSILRVVRFRKLSPKFQDPGGMKWCCRNCVKKLATWALLEWDLGWNLSLIGASSPDLWFAVEPNQRNVQAQRQWSEQLPPSILHW